MKIDDYEKIKEKDFGYVHDDQVNDAATQVAPLTAKWAKFLYNEKMNYQNMKVDHETLVQELEDFYAGIGDKPHPVKLLKKDQEKHVRRDKRFLESNRNLIKQEMLIEYLEMLHNDLHWNRSKNLKTKMDAIKWTSGV